MRRFSFGLQWKLTAWGLLTALVAVAVLGALYMLARHSWGWTEGEALGVAVGGSLLLHLVGIYLVGSLARSVKLRLWEAGDMAGRLALGVWSARLPTGEPDEIGELYGRLNQMGDALEGTVGRLKELAEQNRVLSEEAQRGAALGERAKLARDLHDGVNQLLFVQAMRSAALRKQLARLVETGEVHESVGRLVAEAATLEEGAREAHAEARSLILQLRPTALEQQGLGPALAEYAQTAAQKAGWQIEIAIDPQVRLFGAPAESLFRVAQEALNNVAKHAQATTVALELHLDDEAVRLAIRDDGVGFQASSARRPSAVGLVGMQERMSALGGTIQVRSRPGGGTEVRAKLPVVTRGAEEERP